VPDPESVADLLDRPFLDVLELERFPVSRGQAVQHRVHDPVKLRRVLGVRRLGRPGRLDRFEHRPDLRAVVDQHHLLRSAAKLAQLVDDLPTADLAQPGKERRVAAESGQAPQRLDKRCLDHVLGQVLVTAQPWQGKPVEAREILAEESVEGPLLAREHPLHQLLVFVHGRSTVR
jgi:hypothetical protein